MPLPHKLGTLQPVIYFRYTDGHLTIAPYTDAPTPPDAIREEASSLPEIDRLQSRLNDQCRREYASELAAEEAQFEPARARIRDNLYRIMTSGSTPQAEKDFIAAYLQLREEKREKYRAKFAEYTTYLYAREFDLHGRDPNVEKAPR